MATEQYIIPRTEPGRRAWINNFAAKFADYMVVLGFDASDVAQVNALAQTYGYLLDLVKEVENYKKSIVQFKDDWSDKDPATGKPLNIPLFSVPIPPTVGATEGIWAQVDKWIAKIFLADNYTEAIGVDLGIVKPPTPPPSPDNLQPALKLKDLGGYQAEVVFKKDRQDAIFGQWRWKGTEAWAHDFTLLSSPGQFTVTPETPGKAVEIEVRSKFMKKNQKVGEWSPIYSSVITP